MQLQDMLSRISVRHKSTERVSSRRYVELNIRLVMRRKKLCGESFRTDVTSRLFTRNLSIIFYKVFKNAFKSGSSFQSGMAGVFILVSIVSNALRRASGLAFA